ncbi:MAG: hypothetical protein ACLR0U_21515 [Enterocloster clostridioformis]
MEVVVEVVIEHHAKIQRKNDDEPIALKVKAMLLSEEFDVEVKKVEHMQ